MPQERLDTTSFSPDIREFFLLLHKFHVRYLVVGGEAVIYYGHARLTGDIDLFYDREEENVRALYAALAEFWAGTIPGIADCRELLEERLVVQFGRPPNRIDLLNHIDAISFAEAWLGRHEVLLEIGRGTVPVFYLGLQELIRNKEAAGRPKDLEDLQYLRRATPSEIRRARTTPRLRRRKDQRPGQG